MKNHSTSTNYSLSTTRSRNNDFRRGSLSPTRKYETDFSIVELQKLSKEREKLIETENDPHLRGYYSRKHFMDSKKKYMMGVEEEKTNRDYSKAQFRMLNRYLHSTYGKRSDSNKKQSPRKVDQSEVEDVPEIDIGKKPVNYKFAKAKKEQSNLPKYDDELDKFISDCKSSPEKLPPPNPDDNREEEEEAKSSRAKDINLLMEEDTLRPVPWDNHLESEFRRQMTTSKDSHKRGKQNIMQTFICSETFTKISGEDLSATGSCPPSLKAEYINAKRDKRTEMMMKARETYLEETQFHLAENRKKTKTASPQRREVKTTNVLSSSGKNVVSPDQRRYCKTFRALM